MAKKTAKAKTPKTAPKAPILTLSGVVDFSGWINPEKTIGKLALVLDPSSAEQIGSDRLDVMAFSLAARMHMFGLTFIPGKGLVANRPRPTRKSWVEVTGPYSSRPDNGYENHQIILRRPEGLRWEDIEGGPDLAEGPDLTGPDLTDDPSPV